MKKEEIIFLENRQITRKLKQQSNILSDLRKQYQETQSKVLSNSSQALQQQIRKLTVQRNLLKKQIISIKRDINLNDLIKQDDSQEKIKEIYNLQRQIQQCKLNNQSKSNKISATAAKINLKHQFKEQNQKKMEEVTERFKSISVLLDNQKNSAKYNKLKQTLQKLKDYLQKRNRWKQEQYSNKIKQLESIDSRIFQYQNKDKDILRKVQVLSQSVKQLKQKGARMKTQRMSTENSISLSVSRMSKRYERHSSLKPNKINEQSNQFLLPWIAKQEDPLFQKSFDVKQHRKRTLGQKIRIYLNN